MNEISTATASWSFPEVYEAIAAVRPDDVALIHGDLVRTWGEFDSRSARLSRALLDCGLSAGDVVTLYLPNRPEYMETFVAACRAQLVPMNTNFRYGDEELLEIWRDADARVIVYDEVFADRVDRLRKEIPGVRNWIQVGAASRPAGVLAYETVIAAAEPLPVTSGSGDSPILLYTGGTTGRPKGVIWRQCDLLSLLNSLMPRPLPDRATGPVLGEAIVERRPGKNVLAACPLMHGTGLNYALGELSAGSAVVTLPSIGFDPELLLDTVVARSVKGMVIVGDAFGRPLVKALDEEPGRWDVSGVRGILSSGAMWSGPVKSGLIRHMPRVQLIDGLGSSEASGIASSRSTSDGVDENAVFTPSDRAGVIHDDGTLAVAGDGRIGRLAVSGWLPQGYLNDPGKTAEIFVETAGRRWSIPGDKAELLADGRIRLWGRGSSCINTGGEKVFPEEVERVLRDHADVADVAVVGVPDERFGQSIVALIEPQHGQVVDPVVLGAYVRGRLAGYKVPKLFASVPTVARLENGKLDHRTLNADAGRLWAAKTA